MLLVVNALESGDQSVTLTITDNESAPTVTLGTSATVAENGSDLTLTATLSVATFADVIVTLTGSGTSTLVLTMQVSQQSRSVQAVHREQLRLTQQNDSVYEGSETAIISHITGVSGGAS